LVAGTWKRHGGRNSGSGVSRPWFRSRCKGTY